MEKQKENIEASDMQDKPYEITIQISCLLAGNGRHEWSEEELQQYQEKYEALKNLDFDWRQPFYFGANRKTLPDAIDFVKKILLALYPTERKYWADCNDCRIIRNINFMLGDIDIVDKNKGEWVSYDLDQCMLELKDDLLKIKREITNDPAVVLTSDENEYFNWNQEQNPVS